MVTMVENKRLLVVSGMSGSGKTVALNTLEDLGYYCVDNLPAGLLQALVMQTLHAQPERYPRVALGIDARNRAEDLAILPQALSQLAEHGIEPHIVFLDSSTEALIKRYADTRRRHPLAQGRGRLAEAIERERVLLKPLADLADLVLDTSEMNVHELRRRLAGDLGLGGSRGALVIESFAYRRGVPSDADFVFDARVLPNPHWDARLRPLSGRDAAVRAYFDAAADVAAYLEQTHTYLQRWLPAVDALDRACVTVAIGCTGGRHRSVYVAEVLAERFRAEREDVFCFHRELS